MSRWAARRPISFSTSVPLTPRCTVISMPLPRRLTAVYRERSMTYESPLWLLNGPVFLISFLAPMFESASIWLMKCWLGSASLPMPTR